MINTEELINENINLVYKIASYYYGTDKEDLIQAGILGLLKAKENYDPTMGAKFSTYAYMSIYGEMHQIHNKKIMKVNKDTLKMYRIIEKRRYEEAQILGRVPTNLEMASILEMDVKTIDFACMSASTILSTDSEEDNNRNIYDRIPDKRGSFIDEEIMLNDSLNELSSEERNIIKERYYKDRTQSEVAKKYGYSQVMVSRLESKAKQKIRKYITS